MTSGQSSVGSDSDRTSNPPLALELLRERVIARRRRERQAENWNVVRARRLKVRMVAVCAGVLLLMGIAVYFELERQANPAPVEGAAPGGAVGIA
jgi:hypothetical protein